MDPLYNATCRIRRAQSTAMGTDGLTRSHVEDEVRDVRCSLRQLSVERVQGILGAHQAEGWECRLIYAHPIPTASMIEMRMDGADEEWVEYRVAHSRKSNTAKRGWNLLVTRA